MKKRSIKLFLLLAALLTVPVTFAYVLSGSRWKKGTTTMHTAFGSNISSGQKFQTALENAMQKWNETPFRFVADSTYLDPCIGYTRSSSGTGFPSGQGDRINAVDFRPDVCGNDFGNNVLAITLSFTTSGSLGFQYKVESDIVFNTGFNWDVYSGPSQSGKVDFGRVALHELGHAIGLDHEPTESAIMSSKISSLDALTADDIAGANRLYGAPDTCPITTLALNSLIRAQLADGDCRIQQLYSTGNDTSFVDTYRLSLTQATALKLRMSSAELDSVLLITDLLLNSNDENSYIFDDSNGSCDVNENVVLPAGDYLLLANTYVNPEKCAGNTGGYTLTISDSPYPLLGNTGNTRQNGALSSAIFSGRSRLDTATQAQTAFAATDRITVEARIHVDPAHVGQNSKIYVLASLSNGRQYMMNSAGQFPIFRGLGSIQPAFSRNLQAEENITVIKGLRGSTTGLSGNTFSVFVGYALDSAPQDIHFGSQPITFSIAP